MPDDRDKLHKPTPPAGVASQIAGPVEKPRAEFEEFEPTGVHETPVPSRPDETPMQRMQRQSAEIKNMQIGQFDELAYLRQQQAAMFALMLGAKKAELEEQQKDRAARRDFLVKLGLVLIAAVTALVGLLKISGCGE